MSESGASVAPHDPYAAFRIPDFRRLLIIQLVTSMAGQLQAVAIGWDIYERTNDPLALGFVGLANLAPALALFLPAGHIADRHDRRQVMLVSLVLLIAASTGLALAGREHASVGWMYAFCALTSAAQTLSRPARAALVPSVVPAAILSNAMAFSSSTFQIAGVAGPAIAGAVIAWTGNAVVVYEANLVLLVLATILALRIAKPPAHEAPAGRSWRDLFAGLVHVWNTKVILGSISLDLLAVVFGGATALLPIYAKDILQVGPTGLGWLAAAPAIGAVLMGLAQGYLPPFRRAGVIFFVAVGVFGAATVVFGLSTSFWLSLLMLAILGAADNISVVVRNTVTQTHTPDALRGRVSSVNMVFISASNEFGAFESGLVASFTNPVFAVWSGGVATIILVLVMARAFPDLRRLDRL